MNRHCRAGWLRRNPPHTARAEANANTCDNSTPRVMYLQMGKEAERASSPLLCPVQPLPGMEPENLVLTLVLSFASGGTSGGPGHLSELTSASAQWGRVQHRPDPAARRVTREEGNHSWLKAGRHSGGKKSLQILIVSRALRYTSCPNYFSHRNHSSHLSTPLTHRGWLQRVSVTQPKSLPHSADQGHKPRCPHPPSRAAHSSTASCTHKLPHPEIRVANSTVQPALSFLVYATVRE